jgi:hypothetical protein
MAGIWLDKTTEEVETTGAADDWQETNDVNLNYADISDLTTGNQINFDKTMQLSETFANEGSTVFIYDNLTTYNTQVIPGKQGWELLAACISKITAFSKKHNVLTFIVLHTKPDITFQETPQGIRQMIDSGEATQIFYKSVTIIRRPSLADVYGGGGALSQISGAILVWRPFQKFPNEALARQTLIILDSFRHCKSGIDIMVDFDGAKKVFNAVESDQDKQFGIPADIPELIGTVKNYKEEV